MRKLVIVGAGEFAEIAHYYFTHDSPSQVVGFTVDREYLREHRFRGLPVVPFDEVLRHFPPAEHDMFVALGIGGVNPFRNALRQTVFMETLFTLMGKLAKADGLRLAKASGLRRAICAGLSASIWSALSLATCAGVRAPRCCLSKLAKASSLRLAMAAGLRLAT
jgi:hypothetical protein